MESPPESFTIRRALWIGGLVAFAAFSFWINYQVKANVQARRGSGPVRELGKVKTGETAPDFSISDLSNRVVTLAGYRGQKVVLLDFWATWCGPCRMAMVGLDELQKKFQDRGLEILSVNQGEPADQVAQFMQRKHYGFHVVLDKDGAVSAEYGVQAIPTLVLVDTNGVIQWLQVGYSPDEAPLEKAIEGLLKR